MKKMSLMPKIFNLLLVAFIARDHTIFYMNLVFWLKTLGGSGFVESF